MLVLYGGFIINLPGELLSQGELTLQ